MRKNICIFAAIAVLFITLALTACNGGEQAITPTDVTTAESLPVGTFVNNVTASETQTALEKITTTISNIVTTTRAVVTTAVPTTAVTTTAAPTTAAAPVTTTAPGTTAEVHYGVLSSFTSTDLNGNTVTQDIFKGKKLTMVNVWATFCGPCINEMPDLAAISDEYASKGFQIVGVVSDADSRIIISDAEDIIEETGADYLHIVPSDSLNEAVLDGVEFYPTTFFVDENGNQVGGAIVGSQSKEAWTAQIDELLASME